MAVNFDSYLDVPVENISAAKALPTGHYFADIRSWKGAERTYRPEEGAVAVIEMTFVTTGPDEDVDSGELPANGGVGVLITKDYQLSAVSSDGKVEGGAQSILRNMAEKTCDLDTKGLSFRDVLEALKGQPVKVHQEPRADKRNEGVFYNNITKVLPVS